MKRSERANKPKKEKKPKKVKSIYRIRWGRLILKVGLAIGLTGVFGAGYYVYSVLQDVPTVQESALMSDSSSNMYAADNQLIWTSAKNKRIYVDIEDVPQHYIDFLLATEDSEFYQNKGFSPKGLVNAGISMVKSKLGKGDIRGGSGIEQQLIKLSVFSTNEKDRTVTRKVKELFLSSQLYNNYSKDKILEFYINKIFMGENSYGAQTISNVYFNKNLKDLSISQTAIIAGLGQAPSDYNLYDNPELVTKRRNVVLGRAYELNKITKAEYDEAIAADINQDLIPRNSKEQEIDKITAKHNGFVSSALQQVEDLGYDMEITPLQIHTTLDRDAESKVKDIIDNRKDLFQDDEHQAAVTVVDPRSGYVLAEVGGRFTYEISGLNRATQKNRSSGSSIKPILDYGPAIEYFNWPTNKILDGSPYTYAGTNVTAYDYGGVTHGNSEMKVALRNSYNTPAIRTLNEVGTARANDFISGLGMNSEQTLADTVALGLDTSTTEIASAMGTFGQNGIHSKTQYVTSIEFADKSVKKIEFEKAKAMRESTAFIITDMLKGVVSEKGTMPNGKIDGVTYAAKTGTVGYPPTDYIPGSAAMDLWTVGYTKSLSIALWQGYDTPMEEGHYISEYSATTFNGVLFKTIMEELSKGRDNTDWTMPNTVSKIGKGTGLDANYAPIDEPLSVNEKFLTKPVINSNDDYSNVVKENDTTKFKPVKPNTPKAPADYKPGEWEKALKAEQDKFYEDHKHDKEEALKVGEDE